MAATTMSEASYYKVKTFRNDSLNLTVELVDWSSYYYSLSYAHLLSPDNIDFTKDEYETLKDAFASVDPYVRSKAAQDRAIATLNTSLKRVVAQNVFNTKIK